MIRNSATMPWILVLSATISLPSWFCLPLAVSRSLQSSSPNRAATPEGSQVSIESLIDHNELQAARDRLQEAKGISGETPRILLLEAMILHKEKKFMESLQKLQLCVDSTPDAADVHKLIGLNLVALHREDAAETYFQRAAKLNPNDFMARYYLGLYHLTRKRAAQAEQDFIEVVRLNPLYLDGLNMLAVTQEQRGKHEEAMQNYRKAIELCEKLPVKTESPYLYLGRLLILLDRYEESVLLLQKAVEINPASQGAWLALGQSLSHLEKDAQAIEALQRAARLDPSDKGPHFQMMRIYQRQKRMEEARHEMEIFRKLEEAEKTK